jgi:hypothetical protein
MPQANPFAERMRRAKQILCPFCKEKVPSPRRVKEVFTSDGCLAARCACGAVYAVDETGRLGGQALLDAQVLLCDGDLEQAMSLGSGQHVDVRSQACPVLTIRGGGSRFKQTSASARAWFVRRKT